MKKKIAVFTTGWCCEILTQFLTGLKESLRSEKADLFLFTGYPTYVDSAANKKGEMNIFRLPDLKDFDGTVIFGSGLDFKEEVDRIVKKSNEAGIPVILQGVRREGAYYIGSDNYVATRDMCSHLSDVHGVKTIIFMAGTDDSMDSNLRLKAVKDYLEENGRSGDLIDVYYSKWENAAITRYFNAYCSEGKPLPDAIICANDGLAMETCITLEKNNVDVPGQVLVTGYDHIDNSRIFYPSIASVDQCFIQMGEACGDMWKKLFAGETVSEEVIIPCKFIPAESCKCDDKGYCDDLRRRMGREMFSKRAENTYFNRKLNLIDSTVLSSITFSEFSVRLHDLLLLDHSFEGDSFHVLLEPNFGLSINDPNITLDKEGYSSNMDVLYSMENGTEYASPRFPSSSLIPGYDPEDENRLYAFLALHEGSDAFGYVVFRDCLDKILNHLLQTYQSRLGLVFDKFRHALSLDLINKRLVDIMKRDPLTNVSNRRAYEDKELFLQSQINSDANINFAIAMFDINNLKLVNDSKGHEAGDEYIVRACRLICNVFKHSPVYRVGGDEFIAVLTGNDYINRFDLFDEITSKLSPYTNAAPIPDDYISIAVGIAEYIPTKDRSVQSTVKRADEKMYRHKAEIKGLEINE